MKSKVLTIAVAAAFCTACSSADVTKNDVNKDDFVNYPDGNYVYAFNESVNPEGLSLRGSMYDLVFPAPKSVTLREDSTAIPAVVGIVADGDLAVAADYLTEKLAANGVSRDDEAGFKIRLGLIADKSHNDEYYELTVDGGAVAIAGNSAIGVLNGVKTLIAVMEQNGGAGAKLCNAVVSDYPDLEHRGMMLDIVRNYTEFENVKKVIDYIASYKLNVFHFHIADDEAWRLYIPGIPELTEVGSCRTKTYDAKNEKFMEMLYSGQDPTVDLEERFITREQFVELLRYARSRGVEVVPEIDTPGHSRAAIIAMKARYEKYAATDEAEALRYKIWDDADTSVYKSAQGYTDDVINVALPGVYNFMEKVFDEIHAMYKEAGIKLRVFHFGGDEVAHGALEGSPMVRRFMKEHGMTSVKEVSEYYVDRMAEYVASRGVLAGGWQEAALKHSPEFDSRVAPRYGIVNAWSTNGRSDTVPYTLANSGYPVVLSNVRNFYLDMVYTRHQDENGLRWGGWCNEYTSWCALPFNSYRSAREGWNGEEVDLGRIADGKPALADRSSIKGVQAQLWSETIRNFAMVQSYVFPKILGLVERGWNASPAWGEGSTDLELFNAERAQYNLRIGLKELPRLSRKGIAVHINQPGIIVEDGMLKSNACYPGVEVRYTLDGSEPSASSPEWTAPVSVGRSKLVKAKAFYLGTESVTTYLWLD